MAMLNEAVWRNSSTDFWIGFKLWGAIPLTFLFAAANIPMLLKHGLMREDAARRAGAGRMSEPVLSIRGLHKEYGTGVVALKSINLDIRRGEIFALLGPNGAGKTTLINIICGIVTPSGGEVLVDGGTGDRTSATRASGLALFPGAYDRCLRAPWRAPWPSPRAVR